MFKSRKELKTKNKIDFYNHLKNSGFSQDQLSDERKTEVNIIENQLEFFWIRIYLSEEDDRFEPGDEITLELKPKNESLKITFGSYEKKGLYKDFDESVINYESEDDKKVLCCMVDYNKINKNSEDIPNLRTFFKSSRYYQENLFLKKDFLVIHKGKNIEYTSLSL